jgi:hypothetical protein
MTTATGATIVITQLRRHDRDDGRHYYTARVHADGQHIEVDNYYGTWQSAAERAKPWNPDIRLEVRPEVARALQAKLPRSERGRR